MAAKRLDATILPSWPCTGASLATRSPPVQRMAVCWRQRAGTIAPSYFASPGGTISRWKLLPSWGATLTRWSM